MDSARFGKTVTSEYRRGRGLRLSLWRTAPPRPAPSPGTGRGEHPPALSEVRVVCRPERYVLLRDAGLPSTTPGLVSRDRQGQHTSITQGAGDAADGDCVRKD
ncbi:hypothetical protein E2C01_073311 [Portunus trituberculatus]|uniref:Uncharacterized protein n=1 Tax=Portunus trituberculatus TaxID=210409 RepID=A0A5B7I937_PORTR|nr:hypothetical protein [Portunus trituberculatus]